MKLQVSDNIQTRVIKSFTDVLILKYLKNRPNSSGYEILRYLHITFNIPFSPGTVYHAIYLLERKKLIAGDGDETGRIYCLTGTGEEIWASTSKLNGQIQQLVSSILSES